MDDEVDVADVRVSVRNLGGIDSRQLTFEPGVTVLTGRNATNRTSLLQAIAAGLGGSYGELKSDADGGEVELAFGDETYTRTLERQGSDVIVTGDPYTDEESIVDLFSCLLEVNPARRAVERGDGDALRDRIMAPVDTDEITAAIEDHQRDLRDVRDQIEEIDRRTTDRSTLEARRREAEDDLDDVESELEDVRSAVDEVEADADAAEAAEEVVDELKDARREYERVRSERETQEKAIASLEDEREAVRERLEASSPSSSELEETEAELKRLQRRRRRIENAINDLVSIVEFNERLLDDGDDVLPDAIDGDGVIDELDPRSGTVECWTCGTTVERADVEGRLDGLRGVVADQRSERNELRAEIDDCRDTVAELRENVEERRSLEETVEEIDAEIDERSARADSLKEREREHRERIEDLEERAAESETLRDSDLLERYRRLSELEYERGQLEEQLASIDDDLDELATLKDRREDLESERETLREELSSLRNRIEDLERTAIDTFNEHVETVLDRLGYANVERVWIERTTDGDQTGPVPESTFDLHIVRSENDGTVYEDTVDHLSESEREVVGLVVALAGYLVHDVHERVPFMVLDSLEAIDADRIAALVEYFAEYAPFLVVALLPEDAQALDDGYERVPMDGAIAP